MCKVSDKLKLCTCSSDLEKLKNYWIYYSFVKGKNEFLIGEPLMPYHLLDINHPDNGKIIEGLLNSENVFDVEIAPNNKDRLEISISCKDPIERIMTYGFEYKNNKWKAIKYNYFDWMRRHDAGTYGKIKNALERKKI